MPNTCKECKRCHRKCTGNIPCSSCVEKNVTCVFEEDRKRGRPPGRKNKRKKKRIKREEDAGGGILDWVKPWVAFGASIIKISTEALSDICSFAIEKRQMEDKYNSMKNIAKTFYQCIPCPNKHIHDLAKLIPDGKVGVVCDPIRPFSRRFPFLSPATNLMLQRGFPMFQCKDIEAFESHLKEGYAIPSGGLTLPGPFHIESENSTSVYECSDAIVHGGQSVGAPGKCRAFVIWTTTCTPKQVNGNIDKLKIAAKNHFNLKFVTEMDRWQTHAKQFMRTIPTKSKGWVLFDLLITREMGPRMLMHKHALHWLEDVVEPSISYEHTVGSGISTMLLRCILGKTIENGYRIPSAIKVTRNDGSGSWAIFKNVQLFFPQPESVLHKQCKVVCFTFDKPNIYTTI